jgi:hypothetical protein
MFRHSQGTPTEMGKPIAPPVQAAIGLVGGTISTPDKSLTLVIPPGALSKETNISIQLIENTAWSGIGPGYELGPKSLEIAKPAELVWNMICKQT